MWPNWKRERSQSFRRIGFVPLASWISVSRRYAYFHKPIFQYCPHACVYNSEWFEQNLVKVFSWSVKTQKQHHSRTALGRKRTHGEKDNGEVQCSIKWECYWFRALDAKLCSFQLTGYACTWDFTRNEKHLCGVLVHNSMHLLCWCIEELQYEVMNKNHSPQLLASVCKHHERVAHSCGSS
jgi:hypothetical protein